MRPGAALAAVCYAVAALGTLMLGLARQQEPLTAVGAVATAAPLLLVLMWRFPRVVAAVPGLVLGLAPFATVPGTGFQLVLALAAVSLLLAIMHPGSARPRLGSVGVALIALLAASLLSALATFTELNSLVEFGKWGVTTLAAVALLLGSDMLRRSMSRGFVVGAALGAVVTAVMVRVDPSGGWLDRFSAFGYGSFQKVGERVAVVEGADVVRATGLYLHPNTAGLIFLFALGIAGVTFVGAWRAALVLVLLVGITATFSRAAILSALVALGVFAVLGRISAGGRVGIASAAVLGIAALSAAPTVSDRLLDSFDRNDVGVDARIQALIDYPTHMDGVWLFGRGWYLREFYDPYYAYTFNYAANTPLVVIYRGGIITGIVFLVLLVLAAIVAVRAMRRGVPGAALLGSVFIGAVIIALQVDAPVVTMPPVAFAFALMLIEIQALERPAPPGAPSSVAASLQHGRALDRVPVAAGVAS